jgi:hypothetical protein
VVVLCTGTPAVLGHSCSFVVAAGCTGLLVCCCDSDLPWAFVLNQSVAMVLPVVPDFGWFLVEMGLAANVSSTPVLPTPVVCSATNRLIESIDSGCC